MVGSTGRGWLSRLIREEDGQDLIEYGLLVGVLVVAGLVALKQIGGKVAGIFESLRDALP